MREFLAKDVVAGPTGSEIAAFFDFDGTLIDGYSAAKFMQDRMRRGDISVGAATRLVRAGLATRNGRDEDFDQSMRVGVQALRGHARPKRIESVTRLLQRSRGGPAL